MEVVIVLTYSFSPCMPSKNRACTSCATFLLYDFKIPYTSLPLLSNICTGTFCAFLSGTSRVLGASLVAGWLCSSISLESRLGQVRRKIRHGEKTHFSNLPSVRPYKRRLRRIPSAVRSHLGTAVPMAWRQLSVSLRSSCSNTGPDVCARKSLPTLAGEKNRSSEFTPPFSLPSLDDDI